MQLESGPYVYRQTCILDKYTNIHGCISSMYMRVNRKSNNNGDCVILSVRYLPILYFWTSAAGVYYLSQYFHLNERHPGLFENSIGKTWLPYHILGVLCVGRMRGV